jgi:hypothetical protein
MRALHTLAVLSLPAFLGAQAPGSTSVQRTTAHPMAYHLVLPKTWKPGGSWPVVVAVEAAGMDFPANARAFAAALGDRPWIIVVPHTLTSGPTRYREAEHWVYSPGDWAVAAKAGRWGFDEAGLPAVLADVHARFGGEPRAWLTGWEAGGHTVWGMLLRHPEWWKGVAPVSTNYQGRYLDAENSEKRCDAPARLSEHGSRKTLPVKVFFCDTLPGPEEAGRQFWFSQTRAAIRVAEAHGFAPIPLEVLKGRPHGPQAEAVLAWFEAQAGTR